MNVLIVNLISVISIQDKFLHELEDLVGNFVVWLHNRENIRNSDEIVRIEPIKEYGIVWRFADAADYSSHDVKELSDILNALFA